MKNTPIKGRVFLDKESAHELLRAITPYKKTSRRVLTNDQEVLNRNHEDDIIIVEIFFRSTHEI